MQKYLKNPEETRMLGAELARAAKIEDVYCLIGDLGTGKTEFARGFIHALAGNVNVASPTYNLVLTYKTPKFTIWHFDLYCLKDKSELQELGLDDALREGVSLIEWPEIAGNTLPKESWIIKFRIEGEGRMASIQSAEERT